MDPVEKLTPEQIMDNLLTTDFRGQEFKRKCLLRILEDHNLRDSLLWRLWNN